MYVKIRNSIERHIDRIGRIIFAVVIILWILSQFNQFVQNWLLQQGLLNIIVIALLVEAITYLVEIKRKSSLRGSSRIFRNQIDSRQELDQFIREQKPKKAYLLELSTGSIEDLIALLKDVNCDMRLLVQHPQKAVNDSEAARIANQLSRLQDKIFKDYKNIHIKCYTAPASLRGRNLDEKLLNIGWYTYTYSDNQKIDITGDTNPMINLYTDTEEGKILKEFFTRVFNQLWEYAVPLEDVLKAMEVKA